MRLIFSLDGNTEAVDGVYRRVREAAVDLICDCLLEKKQIVADKNWLHNAAAGLTYPLMAVFDELLECAFSITLDGKVNDFSITQAVVQERYRGLMDSVEDDESYPPKAIQYMNWQFDPLSLIGGAKLTNLQGKIEREISLFLQNEVVELHLKVKNFAINFNL